VSGQDPVETFRIEARELLEGIEQNLLDLSERLHDRELIDAVFRGLHTLKGSGAMFGFDALAAFTHHCETAFDRVRKGEVNATPDLVSAVLNARDHMRALAEGDSADDGEALLSALHRALEIAGGEPVAKIEAPKAAVWRIRFSLPANAFLNGVNPLALLSELRELGECRVIADTSALPPLEELAPTECHLAWRVELTTQAPRSAIEDVFMFVMDDMTLSIESDGPSEQTATVAAEAPDEETAPAAMQAAARDDRSGGDVRKSEQSLRVPAERLDELMDRVGELVIAQSRLKQLASASPDVALRSVSEEVERLASELRETMMVVRMVPISNLFGRFESEHVHLIDAVTTNKTEFFREPSHFDFVTQECLPQIVAEGQRSIRAWSAAASIGAEAYTLAMVFEEFCADHPGLDYAILGTDLCSEVLRQAVKGIYPEAMIEPVPVALRERYVLSGRQSGRREVRIAPQLRAKAAFARLNLMDERYPVADDMDIIFCRNILIYFDKPTQAAVLRRLCSHLRPGGYLFLGHSESLLGVELPVTVVANTVFQRL
jgi:chemotaxis methyl-accepting protein methylase/HPt (histidine-containing phosphotransfer) domain-containing protein